MTIEELIAKLGIDEGKAAEAAKSVKEFLDGSYVPKSRFNEVNEEKNSLKQSVADRDKQMESLKIVV